MAAYDLSARKAGVVAGAAPRKTSKKETKGKSGRQAGWVWRYTKVPVASDSTKKNKEFQSRFRLYLNMPLRKANGLPAPFDPKKLALEIYLGGRKATADEAHFAKLTPTGGPGPYPPNNNAYVYADFCALKPGLYRIKVLYNKQLLIRLKNEIEVQAVEARLEFEQTRPILVDWEERPHRLIMPVRFQPVPEVAPIPFETPARLIPEPERDPAGDDHVVKFGPPPKGKGKKPPPLHTVRFLSSKGKKEFIKVTPSATEKDTVVYLQAIEEADGALDVSVDYGVYQLETAFEELTVGLNGLFTKKPTATVYKKGSIYPLKMFCPDPRITRPTGDPTKPPAKPPAKGGANADNEPVFDDAKPVGKEGPGQCLILCERAPFSGLSKAGKALVSEYLLWHIDDAGDVAPEITEVRPKGKGQVESWVKARMLYPRMPRTNAGFGARHVSLILGREEGPGFGFYQKVELFFHYKGTANPGRTHPNWFYYWSQECPLTPGGGNRAGVTFRPGPAWFWSHHGDGNKSLITCPRNVKSLASLYSMTRHEQKHEHDFYTIIWPRGFRVGGRDIDRDGIRDEWENVAGTWHNRPNNKGTEYTDDKGGRGDLNGDEGYYFETTERPLHYAWSDVRADAAAAAALRAKPDINKLDWSDRKVDPLGLVFWGFDKQKDYVFRAPQGTNNKDHH